MPTFKAFIMIMTLGVFTTIAFAGTAGLKTYIRNDVISHTVYSNNAMKWGDDMDASFKLYFIEKPFMLFADVRAFLNSGTTPIQAGQARFDLYATYLSILLDRAEQNTNMIIAIPQIKIGMYDIHLGDRSIFDPFEFDKSLNVFDLRQEKRGILGIAYQSLNFKAFVRLNRDFESTGLGGAFYTPQFFGFTAGVVANRLSKNTNLAGLYLNFMTKQDYIPSASVSYAYHFNDYFGDRFSEVSASVFGNIQTDFQYRMQFYYNEKGGDNPASYPTLSPTDRYLIGKYYGYVNLTYQYKSIYMQMETIGNFSDYSFLLIPSAKYMVQWSSSSLLIAYFQALLVMPIGKNPQEFSVEKYGSFDAIFRVYLTFGIPDSFEYYGI